MSDAIPTRRGPVPANPSVTFRTHQHTSERQDDGKVVELVHNASGHEYHGIGRAVDVPYPTPEAKAEADRIGRTLYPLASAPGLIAAMQMDAHADADEAPVEDMGDRPDVAGLMIAGHNAALDAVQQAALAGLRTAHTQENSLLALADAHAKEEGRNGGLREAAQIVRTVMESIERADDVDYDDYALSVLRDVVLPQIERAVRS